MGEKIKVHVTSASQLQYLLEIVNSFAADVDLLVDSLTLDAKSAIVWYNVDWTKNVYLQILTDDAHTQQRFANSLKLVGGIVED